MSKSEGLIKEVRENLEKIDGLLHVIEVGEEDNVELDKIKTRAGNIREWAILKKWKIRVRQKTLGKKEKN